MSIYSSMKSSSKIILILMLLSIVFSCFALQKKQNLNLIGSYDLDIPEPSGVTLGKAGKCLWMVSDPPDNRIYRTDLKGKILEILSFQGKNLEGIWYDKETDHLFLVEEKTGEIVEIDSTGDEINRRRIKTEKNKDHGFEGICRDGAGRFWLANEKSPVSLILLDRQFNIDKKFDFPDAGDISDISPDAALNGLWILSDEDRMLFRWNPERGIIARFELPVKKPEGVAVDADSLIYIVSDKSEKLYIFRF